MVLQIRIVAVIFLVLVFSIQPIQSSQPSLESNHEKFENDWFFTNNVASSLTSTRQNLFPVSLPEVGGIILLIFLTGLANAGGLGGGPILVPILIIIFNYSETHAIEIVYALVFGGSLGNFLNVVSKRDSRTQKPLIDYNLGLVCMPFMLLGASLGVVLDRILAPFLTLIGILGVILYSFVNLYTKAKKTYAEESNLKRNSLISQSDFSSLSFPSFIEPDEYTDPKLRSVLKEDRQLFPMKKIAMTVILIMSIMLIDVFRGTKNFRSIIGATYCKGEYWGFLGIMITACCVILIINMKILSKSLKVKKLHNIKTDKNNFELSNIHVGVLLILSFIAGVLAGILGVGGGMIMSPTLIHIGVPTRTLTATTGFFVVQTSFISIFQSCLYRDVPLYDQGFFFLISIVGSYGVSYLLSSLVGKYNRPSLILFALTLVLALCLITTPIFVILKNMGHFKDMLLFGSMC